jgi:RsmE family RNA methyltransferase
MHFLVSDFGEFWVPPEEAQVMFSHRLTRDDEIKITDLKGQTGVAVIEGFDKQTKRFRIRVVHKVQHPVLSKTIVFQALLDKTYMDQWAEIIGFSNVTQIFLFNGQFSQSKHIDPTRLLKILIRSLLLSERYFIPQITMINTEEEFKQLLLAHNPAILDSKGVAKTDALNSVCIGPEGGFAKKEYELFEELNLTRTSLGHHIYPGWLAGFVSLSA